MNGTLAIARRELAERRVIFITAAVLAVLPFAMLLSADLRRFGVERVIAAGGAFVALAFNLALALLLGATFIGRELSDRRLSFYFAKPVSAAAIWFGKLFGGLATIAIAAAIILVPSMVASFGQWAAVGTRGLVLFALAVVALFLLAHAIGTMFRSRSPLVLADAACAAVAAGVLYLVYEALDGGGARTLIVAFVFITAALLLAFLVAAGAWQLSRGRIDPVRSHRELSRFLWSAVGVTLALLGAIVLWIVSVTPADLGPEVWAAQPPAGKWMMLGGRTRHRGDYTAGFYVNLENGAYERAEARSIWRQTFFTRDGRVAGQLRPIGVGRNSPMQLDLVRFGATEVEVTPTRVTFAGYARPVIDDGVTRVAAVVDGILTVQSLPDGRSLAAVRLPRPSRDSRLFFTADGRLRMYMHDEQRVDVYELDVPSRRLERTGSFSCNSRMSFNADADGSRLLVRTASELLVLDGRTASRIATLPGSGRERGVLLSDGRVAVLDAPAGKLSIYGTDHAVQHEVALPPMRYVPLVREVKGGTLIVGGHGHRVANEPDGRGWNVYVIDLATGAVVRTGRDLRPIGPWQLDPRRSPADADAPFVFLDRRGAVVLWDAANGSRRAITRASASLPAALLAAVLHLQPVEQRAEVIDDRGGIHLPLAR